MYNCSTNKFDKSTFIPPTKLLDKQSIRYLKKGDWLTVFCPFHKGGSECNPSLSMHSISGHFKCHACGIKGGDIIQFYRTLTGCSFTEAVKYLGGYHA